eukprot:TRINITY_DN100_c0_g1_i3.p1 TRINITY_DN100_c0_g1~~TRINITY_DN100_c0_g1_i3.p1  ORF type:complete len:388 (-),score=81.61 TRINITY_DN100_c0_g1_i3:101-1264(-)
MSSHSSHSSNGSNGCASPASCATCGHSNEKEKVDDVSVSSLKPLISPACLIEDLPLSYEIKHHIVTGRREAASIIKGTDDRLLAVVGPCSIHDYQAAIDYGNRLKVLADKFKDDIFIVMRVYFEKPRTILGWKGFINDPLLDNTYSINKGLRLARSLLLEINKLGLYAATELLDTISPQFVADLITWGAIGARTTESQVHRELASGMSMPVGFKNGTDGRVGIAIDACRAAAHPHHFLGVTKEGISAIIATKGNKSTHIILRGSSAGPNFEERFVTEAAQELKKVNLPDRVMVDCSHGNCNKDYKKQRVASSDVAKQLASGSENIMGVMIESNIVEGRQDIPKEGPSALIYGKSITDPCVNLEETEIMLEELARGVRERRAKNTASK